MAAARAYTVKQTTQNEVLTMLNDHVIDVALGRAPADLVIKGGTLVNVDTREVYPADIAVADGLIAATGILEAGAIGPDTKVINAAGKYLAPGFIDAHIHFESSMLTFTEFSRAVLTRGTTAVATDLMEIAIVAGMDGIREIFREADGLPLTLLHTVPAFMSEESSLQTIGAALRVEMIEALLKQPQAVGLAEVLFPPILAQSPQSAWMLKLAENLHKTAEGHAPALLDAKLDAYVSAGIRSDHESTSREEALAKARAGLRVLMREGSASTDLEACLKIITEDGIDPRGCSMVSDDIDMLHIIQKGHLDHKVRMAVKAGADPVVALQMVSINPAQSLMVDRYHGSLTPGKYANIVLLRDLATCDVDSVVARGKLAVQDGQAVFETPDFRYKDCMLKTVKLQKPVTAQDLLIKTADSAQKATVHVIGAHGHTLLTDKLEATLPVRAGYVQPDAANDILHIACVERYGKNGSIGRSFIKGFGLCRGAIATSVGHDHHNITALGASAEDMAVAVNRIAELGGGITIAEDGQVIYELPLPICGLLTTLSARKSADILDRMQRHLAALGCDMASPYMTLAFITLIFIPMLGITDRGLVDVLEFKVIDPVIAIQ
jgi:adenine deaminase